MDWLGLSGKTVLVAGVANKKSVGWHVGKRLQEQGADVIWVVHGEERRAELAAKLGGTVLACDVSSQAEIDRLGAAIAAFGRPLHGVVHSIAFGRYDPEKPAFLDTPRESFLEAVNVSCFSLVALSRALLPALAPRASIVALSISSTRTAAENYGFMGPVKAALDSTVVFLAKSLAARGEIRVNAVCAGPLKTASSAGIPGYLESYLHAEALTLRKRGLATEEVADAVLWLLSERSSGIDAQGVVVDAGMGVNAFDRDVVRRAARPE